MLEKPDGTITNYIIQTHWQQCAYKTKETKKKTKNKNKNTENFEVEERGLTLPTNRGWSVPSTIIYP